MRAVFMRYVVLLCLFWQGSAFAQSQTLPAGWSLVGNDSAAAIDVVGVFGNKTTPTAVSASVTTVWSWNNSLGRWNFFSPSMTEQELSSYAMSKNYGVLSSISKGSGFWVNATNQFVYSPASTATSDISALQGADSSVSINSSVSGAGCAALGVTTGSNRSSYMSMSVTTVGPRATVNMWNGAGYLVFTLDYQSGNNTTGYSMTGTFQENISGFTGTASGLSFRQTSWGSYVGFFSGTTNNCTMTFTIG